MRQTGADAVMSASALLGNPRLFEGPPCADREAGQPTTLRRLSMADEYLRVCESYPEGALPRLISQHLFAGLIIYSDVSPSRSAAAHNLGASPRGINDLL